MKIKFEDMLPEELLQLQKEGKWIFLPIGSMEWHSLHMGMGVDTLHAEAVAERLAAEMGGAVFPPLYIGTESERTSESLKRLGFTGEEHIYGMDFPANSIRSCYWPPELFRQIVAEQVRLLRSMGFCRIAVLNGHGAAIQREILQEVCEEARRKGGDVRTITVLFRECGVGLGHAGLLETAVMQALRPDTVKLERLPEKPEKISYKDFGISDSGGSDGGFFVRNDPRDATGEAGEQILTYEVRRCRELLEETEEGKR